MTLLVPTLAASALLVNLLAILFVVSCVFLILVILVQKPRGGGLSGAFGGGGGAAQSVCGGKTGDALTKFTVICFVFFILLAMGLTWATRPSAAPTSTVTSQPAQQTPSE